VSPAFWSAKGQFVALVEPTVPLSALPASELASLEQELAVYQRVQHENVITYRGRVRGDEHRLSFLLEWCEAGSLRDVLDHAAASHAAFDAAQRW